MIFYGFVNNNYDSATWNQIYLDNYADSGSEGAVPAKGEGKYDEGEGEGKNGKQHRPQGCWCARKGETCPQGDICRFAWPLGEAGPVPIMLMAEVAAGSESKPMSA
jgi:hypothetical protein